MAVSSDCNCDCAGAVADSTDRRDCFTVAQRNECPFRLADRFCHAGACGCNGAGAVQSEFTDTTAALNLSLAYWDAGQKQQSLQVLSTAANLAGPSNTQFFSNAGDQFKQRQAWFRRRPCIYGRSSRSGLAASPLKTC